MTLDLPRRFIVAVHDIEPDWMPEITTIYKALRPLIGDESCAAIISEPWVRSSGQSVLSQVREIQDSSSELMIHGVTHRGDTKHSLFSKLVDSVDEFRCISRGNAITKLKHAKDEIGSVFLKSPKGFAPPAWARGAVDVSVLRCCGLQYETGWFRLANTRRFQVDMATFSWDCGNIPQLGYLGELAGRISSLQRHRLPQLVFHPKDVIRGFLPLGLSRIRTLLRNGYQPVVFSDLLKQDLC